MERGSEEEGSEEEGSEEGGAVRRARKPAAGMRKMMMRA